jgi:NADPH:quinone reductase-like Zn-dependent oxidoreductase
MQITASEKKPRGVAARVMKAIRIHAFGGEDALQLEELPLPAPGDGEMLVRIHAASVNPVDAKIRAGSYPAVKEDQLPYTLGRDLSGTIEKLGPGTKGFRRGDAVFAYIAIERGAYAEFAIVKPGEAAARPSSLDHVAAAALPLAGITAWQGLFDHGKLRTGQRVLIHGGAGGVGHLAVQFAKAHGAWVATTVSAKDVDFARELGADLVIDYKAERFENKVQDLDLVFDLIAGETQERSWKLLKKGGILVSTLQRPSEEKARQFGVQGTRYTAAPHGGQLAEIARLVDEGKVQPHVEKTFALAEAREAQHFLENEHVRGKLVLEVTG